MNIIKNPDAEGKMEDMIKILKAKDKSHIKIWFDLGDNWIEIALTKDAALRLSETIKEAVK